MAPSRPPRPPTRPPRDPKELLKKRGADLIRKVSDKDRYAIFLEPVDLTQVEGYADLIERPMDLSTLQKNLQMGVYRTPMELRADLDLIWSNCCTFNADDSIYYKEAVRLRALCERYYDELIRVLSRDGVAAALGLTNSRRAGPYSRSTSKRPPRHRMPNGSGPASAGVSSSLLTSEPTSPEPDADASGSASASASASGAQPTFRDAQIRRTRAAAEAAAAAAEAAAEEARAAAKAAGMSLATSSSHRQIFSGPGAVLRSSSSDIDALRARQLQVLNHRKMRDRCAEVPVAWRRVGRWHSRGATLPKFATKERALNVRYGRVYQKYIRDSAPAARRLLATVLDPETVRKYDLDLIAMSRKSPVHGPQEVTSTKNGIVNGTDAWQASIKSESVPMDARNENRDGFHTNGILDPMDTDDAETKTNSDKPEERMAVRSRKRKPPTQKNGATYKAVARSRGTEFVDKLLKTSLSDETLLNNAERPSKQILHASKKEISRLQLTLKENGIDPGFVGGLLSSLPGTETRKSNVQAEGGQSGHDRGPLADELEHLLDTNHATMMNVLRLRALRESADEADCEDLEDRERELVERLAKDISLVVRKLPPRAVVHPADATETAIAMSHSVQSRSQSPK